MPFLCNDTLLFQGNLHRILPVIIYVTEKGKRGSLVWVVCLVLFMSPNSLLKIHSIRILSFPAIMSLLVCFLKEQYCFAFLLSPICTVLWKVPKQKKTKKNKKTKKLLTDRSIEEELQTSLLFFGVIRSKSNREKKK